MAAVMVRVFVLMAVVMSSVAKKKSPINIRDSSLSIFINADYLPDCPVCETEECISTAARILESLDTSVDPCTDFYEFSCGGWIKDTILPPHRPALQTLYDADKHLASARNLLAEDHKPSDLDVVKKAKDLYASCIEYATRTKPDQTIVEEITSRFGKWPLTVTEWDEESFHLENLLTKAAYLDVSPLVKLKVSLTEYADRGKVFINHFLMLDRPDLGLPSSVYVDGSTADTSFQMYVSKIYEDAERFGIEDPEKADEAAKEIVEVEIALAELLYASRNVPPTNVTLTELQENFGKLINWRDFVINIASSEKVGITDITCEEPLTSLIHGYLANMTEYFSNLPARTQANYIIWRVVDSLDSVLVEKPSKIQTLLNQAIYGTTAEPSPEESCVNYVSKAFGLVVHRLLYADKFPPEEMKTVYTMLKEIQTEFDHVLAEQDWVDEETAHVIREKNAALATTMLFFEQAMNDSLLDIYYANLESSAEHAAHVLLLQSGKDDQLLLHQRFVSVLGKIINSVEPRFMRHQLVTVTINPDSFIESVLAEKEESFLRNLRLLRTPYQQTLEELPHEMVAQNNYGENQMEYTSILFEPPAFIAHVPQSLNYGALGVIFGHEIIHSFDNDGYVVNKDGVYGDWWTNETVARFEERQQCLIDQYSNFRYKIVDKFVDGKLTLGENMGDNGGIKLAFRAYKKYAAALTHEEPLLPGVDFSHDQLFFLSFAQLWCNVENKDAARAAIKDVHSPHKFRVIGTVQNSKDFSRAFKCPEGSKMNPKTKCEVW